MKVSVIGVGYVGLVSGTCFSEMGNDVICVDIDAERIQSLKQGIIPIYEPGLEKMVLENYHKGTLNFTTNIKEALEKSDICFIAVGTPMGEDGSADLQYVLSVARSIGEHMTHHMYVIDKSTVPVGTAYLVKDVIQSVLDSKKSNLTFDVISNPEFLKEGNAIVDFMRPDRVVIGAENEKSFQIMHELYEPFIHRTNSFITMDIKSAEITKYAANALLATKISFMNELANICEKVGADINQVRNGVGSDTRIGYSFIYAGCGYGGSCFPKDIQALVKTAKDVGYNPRILNAIEAVNFDQKRVIVNKVIDRFGKNLQGRTFGLWGLSFKPETNDMRESTSIVVVNELTSMGAKIKAYDPKAINEAKNFYLKDNKNIEYVESKYDALAGCDAMILLTEWKEFRSPDFDEIGYRLNNKIIFDGRNQYNKEKLADKGFEYFQIGVGI